jgi:hypothetical protein
MFHMIAHYVQSLSTNRYSAFDLIMAVAVQEPELFNWYNVDVKNKLEKVNFERVHYRSGYSIQMADETRIGENIEKVMQNVRAILGSERT